MMIKYIMFEIIETERIEGKRAKKEIEEGKIEFQVNPERKDIQEEEKNERKRRLDWENQKNTLAFNIQFGHNRYG